MNKKEDEKLQAKITTHNEQVNKQGLEPKNKIDLNLDEDDDDDFFDDFFDE